MAADLGVSAIAALGDTSERQRGWYGGQLTAERPFSPSRAALGGRRAGPGWA